MGMMLAGSFAFGQSCPATFNVGYSQNFDGIGTCGTSCGTVCTTPSSISWTNETTDDGDWLVDANGTTSSSTGPSGDNTSGSGNYLYTEASGCANDVKILTSPCFDVSGAACPAFTFAYHMFGATMGSLDVEVSFDQGVTWTSRFNRSGDQGNAWQQGFVDISGPSTTVKVRFVGVTGTSFTSDMAIDDVAIIDASNQTFNAAFSGLPATASVNDPSSTLVPSQSGGNFSGPGVSGNSFSPSAAGPGVHVITYTIGPGSCAVSSSQTITVTGATCPSPTEIAPYTEDFENQSTCTPSCGTSCGLIDNWTNDPNDDTDWLVDVGGTTSSSTGPSTDFIPGTSAGKYLYIETSGTACQNATANLISPCILVTPAQCPVLTWGYHMFGATQGTHNVDISTDAGSTWTNVFSVSGNQGDQWNRGVVDLTSYVGQTIRVRLQGITGGSFTSDLAVDGVQVIDFSTQSPVFDIVASGNVNPASISVFDNPANLVAATPGGSYTSIPATPALVGNTFDPSLATPGVYIITYNVGPAACNLSFTRVLQVTNLSCTASNTVSNFPYSEDFDGFSTCTASCGAVCPLTNGWINSPQDDFDWTTDANGTGSTGTGPSGDHTSGSGNYLYTETSGTACQNSTAELISPCFDLTGLQCPNLEFFYHQFGATQGTLSVDISLDGGTTWANLFSSTGNQGDQWNQGLIDLSNFTNNTVRFRFVGNTGSSFTGDMAIDDVSIIDLGNADPSFAGLPATSCTSSDPITLVPATPGGTFNVSPATTALSGTTFDPSVAGAGTYTITYQTPGPATCFSVSQPQTITILPPPSITASNDVVICEGTSTTLTASSSNCPNPGQVFYTDVGAIQTITTTGENFNVSFFGPFPAATGDVTITINARGDFGFGTTETIDIIGENNTFVGNSGNLGECSVTFGSADVTIPVALFNAWVADGQLDLVIDNLSGVNTFCADNEVFLTLRYPAGGCGFLWSNGEVANSITVSPTESETYFVTVIDSGGCETTDSVRVTVIPSPIVDAGEDQTICEGETVDLGVIASPAGGGVNPGANQLQTTFAGGNGAGGNQFDIVAGAQNVTITGFSGNFSSATVDVEIFYKVGTQQGFENNAGAWTSLGTANGVATNGIGSPTAIPIPVNITIPAGQTYAFYVHLNSGSITYTNGTSQGNVFVSDGNISVLEGTGHSTGTPFVSQFNPRVWNGIVSYNLPGQGGQGNGITLLWSTGATTDSISVSPPVTTDYIVTATDSFGCAASDTVTVNVNENPDLTFAFTYPTCFDTNDGAIDLTIVGDTNQQGAPASLTTTFAGGNGQAGNMFDIVATTAVTVTGFDVHIGATTAETVEIYTKAGSHVGFETNASAWTLIATVNVTGQGAGNPTPLPANVIAVPIAAGQSQSFYVTLSTGTDIDYTNGTSVGNVLASDASITVLEGVGKAYPFAGTFTTRNWNGTVQYTTGSLFESVWTDSNGDTLTTDRDLFNIGVGDYTISVTNGATGCNTTQTINLPFVDNIPPVISCPPNMDFQCVVNVPSPDPNEATATDNCDSNPVITVADTDNGGAGCLGSPLVITRTYTATDFSGNSASCAQTLTVDFDTLVAGTCQGCDSRIEVYWDCINPSCVYVNSCKDLSNIVFGDVSGNEVKIEFNGPATQSGYFCTSTGLPLETVWVKAGCYQSGDGPGYGHRFDLCGTGQGTMSNVQGGGDANGGILTQSNTGSGNQGRNDNGTGNGAGGSTWKSGDAPAGLDILSSLEAYPNPFDNATRIRFSVGTDADVQLRVYDLRGTEVVTLFEGQVVVGEVNVVDFKPENLATGIYYARLTTATGESMVQKLVFK